MEHYQRYILANLKTIKDYPIKGVSFKDLNPVLRLPGGINTIVHGFEEIIKRNNIQYTHIAAVESRGFIYGAILAQIQKKGLIPIRKKGKLPPPVITKTYQLEYGVDFLEIPAEIFKPSDRILIIDDVLATGGTVSATKDLVTEVKGNVVGACFVLELSALKARQNLNLNIPLYSLIKEES